MTVMTFDGKTFEVDDDIAALVHALNTAGIATVASCSGHGMRPGRISLADGRELFVLPSYEIAQWFDTQFPRDINGQTADERTETLLEAKDARIAELLEERDELAKDAARYRWLRKGESDDVAVVRGLGAMDYGMSAVVYTYSEEIDGDDLDAAIDEAMEKEVSND